MEAKINPELLAMQRRYRHIVETFVWINGKCRPDIVYNVLILCSFMHNLAGASLSSKVGFQTRISLSTADSEVRAIAALRKLVKYILYLKKVFISLNQSKIANSAYIALANLPLELLEDK